MIAIAAAAAAAPLACEATWNDTARNRDLPVRITMPGSGADVPVVVWSPGLGGDQRSGRVWANAWAAAGFAVVQMAHPGSDAAVYRPGGTPEARRARVLAATAPDQIEARTQDARFVLSELGRRPAEGACNLRRIDTSRAAIAGHSMGAWVAQGIAGQRFPPDDVPLLRDQRFRAAIAFSPSAAPGTSAFRRIGVPFLAITGTLDGTTAAAPPAERAAALAARTAPFESMPADGRKCLLVIDDAAHMMFAGNRAAGTSIGDHVETLGRQVTITFLKAVLSEAGADEAIPAARALAPADRYRCK